MKKPKFLTNWKTTVMGLMTAAVTIFPQVINYMDNDAATVVDVKVVLIALGILFGFSMARDGDKSSEGKQV